MKSNYKFVWNGESLEEEKEQDESSKKLDPNGNWQHASSLELSVIFQEMNL